MADEPKSHPCPIARVDRHPHDAHDWVELFNGSVHCPGYSEPEEFTPEQAPPKAAEKRATVTCGEMKTHGGHRYMLDAKVNDCPGVAAAPRPPARFYEVRTVHGEVYWAAGDVVEEDAEWLTIRGDEATIELRVPGPDLRVLRQIDPDEMDTAAETVDDPLAALVQDTLGISLGAGQPVPAFALDNACRQLAKSEAAREHLRTDRDSKRQLLTEALGMDALRDWDDIVNAARGLRDAQRDRELDRREAVMDEQRFQDQEGR